MNSSLYFSVPGVICGAGLDSAALWNSCIAGNQNGIKRVTSISGKEFFACKIDDAVLTSVRDAKYDMRIIRILNKALEQIEPVVEKVKNKFGADRIAVCLGSCDNGSEFSLAAHRVFFETGNFPCDYELDVQGASYPAEFIKEKCGLKGPAYVFSTACSSSSSAIIKAKDLLLAGIADAVIAGGVDVASDTVLLGFDSLEAVSDEIANPFSKNRKGITLGEGACLFVMSLDKELVSENGCNIKLLGTGESSDANHITAPLEDGSGAAQAVKEALENSALCPEQIDYLNLHGTGTHLNDSMEAKAVKNVFGEYCSVLPVSSTKSLTGHTLGASGAIELAVCYMALVHSDSRKLPVHVFDGVFDESLPRLNFVTKDFAAKKEINTAMSNSFGFGGCNISLIIGKENG